MLGSSKWTWIGVAAGLVLVGASFGLILQHRAETARVASAARKKAEESTRILDAAASSAERWETLTQDGELSSLDLVESSKVKIGVEIRPDDWKFVNRLTWYASSATSPMHALYLDRQQTPKGDFRDLVHMRSPMPEREIEWISEFQDTVLPTACDAKWNEIERTISEKLGPTSDTTSRRPYLAMVLRVQAVYRDKYLAVADLLAGSELILRASGPKDSHSSDSAEMKGPGR